MDEANRSLQRAPTKAQLHTMRIGVIALAQREALKAIKRQMQAKGLRLLGYPAQGHRRSGCRLSSAASFRVNRRCKGGR
jgi:hypothetical protein